MSSILNTLLFEVKISQEPTEEFKMVFSPLQTSHLALQPTYIYMHMRQSLFKLKFYDLFTVFEIDYTLSKKFINDSAAPFTFLDEYRHEYFLDFFCISFLWDTWTVVQRSAIHPTIQETKTQGKVPGFLQTPPPANREDISVKMK